MSIDSLNLCFLYCIDDQNRFSLEFCFRNSESCLSFVPSSYTQLRKIVISAEPRENSDLRSYNVSPSPLGHLAMGDYINVEINFFGLATLPHVLTRLTSTCICLGFSVAPVTFLRPRLPTSFTWGTSSATDTLCRHMAKVRSASHYLAYSVVEYVES